MEASLTEILLAIGTLGGLFGGGLKYLLDRVSKRQSDLEARQEAERTRQDAQRIQHELKVETERLRWEAVMNDQLLELRREVRLQEYQIDHLRAVSDAYLRHIAALEGLMRAAGIQIPVLVLPTIPPPPALPQPRIAGPGPTS